MPDEPSILAVAEADRNRVEQLLNDHVRACKHHGCRDCLSLSRHLSRTERQTELLAGGEPAMEAMF